MALTAADTVTLNSVAISPLTKRSTLMDQRQIEEFIERSQAFSMRLTEAAERQLDETIRIAERPWWVPFSMALAFSIGVMGFGAVLAYLMK
jgi:hypothetical protein